MAKKPTEKTTNKTSIAATVKKAATKKVAVKKAAPVKAVVKKAAVKNTAVKTIAPVKKTVTKKVAAPKKVAKKAAATKPEAIVTTIIAKVDAGFGNEIFLRGSSPDLKWETGVLMENAGADEWVWKSTSVSEELEFKVLLNDEIWSVGPNGVVFPGATVVFEPAF